MNWKQYQIFLMGKLDFAAPIKLWSVWNSPNGSFTVKGCRPLPWIVHQSIAGPHRYIPRQFRVTNNIMKHGFIGEAREKAKEFSLWGDRANATSPCSPTLAKLKTAKLSLASDLLLFRGAIFISQSPLDMQNQWLQPHWADTGSRPRLSLMLSGKPIQSFCCEGQ